MANYKLRQLVNEIYFIEAESEEQALEILYSGEITPDVCEYNDVVIESLED